MIRANYKWGNIATFDVKMKLQLLFTISSGFKLAELAKDLRDQGVIWIFLSFLKKFFIQ